MKPGASDRPIALDRGWRCVERFGCLFHAHAGEKPALDDTALTLAHGVEPLEGFLEREQVIGAGSDAEDEVGRLVERNCVLCAFSLLRATGDSMIDQHTSHCTRGNGKKVCAITPAHAIETGELEVRLVDESGRVERVPFALALHAQVSDAPELLIQDRNEAIYRLAITA